MLLRNLLRRASFASCALAAVIGFSFAEGSAERLELSPGDPFPELEAGQTVVLAPGTYAGPWAIRAENVTVEGQNAVIVGPSDGSAVQLLAAGIHVKDLRIEDAGTVADLYAPDAGFWLVNCNGCVLERVSTFNTPSGLRIESSPNVRVLDSVLESGANGPGVTAYQSSGLRLENLTTRGFLDGVYVERSDDVEIQGAEIQVASRYGLHVMFAADLRITGSTVSGGGVGSAVMYGRDALLEDNVLMGHEGPLAYGLLVHEMSNVTARHNRIENNTVGLLIVSSQGVHVEGNDVHASGTGILVRRTPGEATSDVMLTANTFISNVGDVAVDDPEAAIELLGNAFDRASALDRNHDGISDVPVLPTSSFALLQTRQPDLSLFAMNPGVLLWEAAEAWVPAVRLAQLHDPLPQRTALERRPAGAPLTTALRVALVLLTLGLALAFIRPMGTHRRGVA